MPVRTVLLLLLAAVGYVVSPIDVAPDVIPLLGWVDDLLVLGALGYMFFSYLPRHGGVRWRDAEPAEDAPAVGTADAAIDEGYAGRFSSGDPYVVLGLSPSAGGADVTAAYKTLLKQYHPDKVAHLSREFQELAHERSVAIQDAFSRIGVV